MGVAEALPDSSSSAAPSAANIPLPVISFHLGAEHGFLKGQKNNSLVNHISPYLDNQRNSDNLQSLPRHTKIRSLLNSRNSTIVHEIRISCLNIAGELEQNYALCHSSSA